MKKFYLYSLLTALLLLCSTVASAHDFEVDGIYYNITDATAKTVEVSRSSYSGAVIIPSSVTYNGTTYSVTCIGESAFYNCTGLTSVTIGNSVTGIGDAAFAGCHGLTSIEIPNSVTSIGSNAFYGCTGLASVTIPNSVTSIGDNAFQSCSELTSVTIGNSVTSIGNSAFFDCSGLTSIVIPNSVTGIGEGAFEYCSGLTSITVNSGNSIYDSREGCNAIIETATNTLIAGCKNTIIPNSVTSIGDRAFSDCTGLTSIEIPNSVTSIGDNAFQGCTGLTGIVIPNSVTSIGNNAFNYCTGLTSIEIPNSVTSIGDYAFVNCTGLTSVTIGNSVTSIGEGVFYRCSGLANITVNSDNSIYDSREGCNAIIETATNTLIIGCENTIIPNSVTSIGERAFNYCTGLTSIEIPNSVTSIGDYAFVNCTGLTSVTIGNSVTSIGKGAFYRCTGLTSVTIGNSVTSIGDYAFYYCSGLTGIVIPNSVTSIGERAFYYCTGLTSVTIGNSVTSIGRNVFNGCRGLTEIYSLAKTPPTINSSTFNKYSVTLYVPYGAKSAYQAANYWKNFTNIVEMEPESASGDVNGDGRVSVADITTVVDAILNESSDTAYDVNGDSRVSVADITTIVDIILNEGASSASNAAARVATRSTSALSLYIDPFEIEAGEEKEILVNLSNAGTEITAVEFDLFLPEGLEVVSDEYGYYILHGSRTPNKRNPHAVSGDLLSSGAIHVICYHNSQLAFTGEDGDVVAITIKAADDLEPGSYTIDLKNIELVNPADPKNGILISDNNTVATDIDNIEAEEGTTEIYDLNGRRVNNLVKGGIYIINGKKVVVE